ncbi:MULTISPECIES: hypothetical protein [unclassified Bradyrhizobium]
MSFTFDTTISIPGVVGLLLFVGGIIGGWYKFGGRLNMLEYRVGAIENTLKILSETLKSIAETDKKIAVIDQRQLALESSNATMLETIERLRRGEGYITSRRGNLEGEYTR